jgi:hypothetical protein
MHRLNITNDDEDIKDFFVGELATDEQFGRILDLVNLSYGYDETKFEIEDYIEKLNVRHRSRIQNMTKQ